MSKAWLKGLLALGVIAAAALSVGCRGARQQQTASPAEVANTQSASLRIGGMT